jgi:hypothetical protein
VSVSVGSPFAVRLAKRVNEATRRRDLKRFTGGLSKADRARVRRGYLGPAWADRTDRKALAAAVG